MVNWRYTIQFGIVALDDFSSFLPVCIVWNWLGLLHRIREQLGVFALIIVGDWFRYAIHMNPAADNKECDSVKLYYALQNQSRLHKPEENRSFSVLLCCFSQHNTSAIKHCRLTILSGTARIMSDFKYLLVVNTMIDFWVTRFVFVDDFFVCRCSSARHSHLPPSIDG